MSMSFAAGGGALPLGQVRFETEAEEDARVQKVRDMTEDDVCPKGLRKAYEALLAEDQHYRETQQYLRLHKDTNGARDGARRRDDSPRSSDSEDGARSPDRPPAPGLLSEGLSITGMRLLKDMAPLYALEKANRLPMETIARHILHEIDILVPQVSSGWKVCDAAMDYYLYDLLQPTTTLFDFNRLHSTPCVS